MFANTETEKGAQSREFSRDRTFLQVLVVKMADEFAYDAMVDRRQCQGFFSGGRNISDELVEINFVANNRFRRGVALVAEVMQEFFAEAAIVLVGCAMGNTVL